MTAANAGTLHWNELLASGQWLHVVTGRSSVKVDTPSTVHIAIIDGKHCTTAAELFSQWAAAFHFPSYFGHNWDALEECLLDLDWLSSVSGFVTLVRNADQLLAREATALPTFLDILKTAAAHWRQSRKPLVVVMETSHGASLVWLDQLKVD
jgi:RNAse (barnase) inhibitor barstar